MCRCKAGRFVYILSEVFDPECCRTEAMGTEMILTNVAILLLVATVWNYLQHENRLTPARRTWLSVAGIFALVSALLQLFRR